VFADTAYALVEGNPDDRRPAGNLVEVRMANLCLYVALWIIELAQWLRCSSRQAPC